MKNHIEGKVRTRSGCRPIESRASDSAPPIRFVTPLKPKLTAELLSTGRLKHIGFRKPSCPSPLKYL
jgi:hypothetical protein